MQVEVKTIRGIPTGWVQQGRNLKTDPVLFFIHGFPDTPQTWVSQLQFFSSEFLTVAPYARGVSPSEGRGGVKRFGMDSVVLDHFAILRHVDPLSSHPVVIVGHDIGAMHAWHLARLLKDRLCALVIINGVSLDQMLRRMSHVNQLIQSGYIAFFQLPVLPEWVMRHWGNTIIPRLRKRQGALSETAPVETVIPMIEMYRQAFRQAFTYPSSWPIIDTPTLVLWGNRDRFLGIPSMSDLRKLVKHVTMRVLDGGHWIHEEQSAHVNTLIRNFLNSALGKSRYAAE